MAEFDLTAQLHEALGHYREDVAENVKKVCKRAAKKARQEIEDASPVRKSRGGGRYKKGWKIRTKETRGGIGITVYNKTDYQLTHLLEYGHAKVNGGRVPGRAHIKPVDERMRRTVEAQIREVLEG